MQVTFTLTLQEFRKSRIGFMPTRYRILLSLLRTLGQLIVPILVSIFIIMPVITVTWLGTHENFNHTLALIWGTFLVSTALLFGISNIFSFWVGRWHARKLYKTSMSEKTVTITPDCLLVETNSMKAEYKWEAISRAKLRFGMILLNTGKRSGISIPLRVFSSNTEAEEFISLIHTYRNNHLNVTGRIDDIEKPPIGGWLVLVRILIWVSAIYTPILFYADGIRTLIKQSTPANYLDLVIIPIHLIANICFVILFEKRKTSFIK